VEDMRLLNMAFLEKWICQLGTEKDDDLRKEILERDIRVQVRGWRNLMNSRDDKLEQFLLL